MGDDPARMAVRIDDALRAIEERFGKTDRINKAEDSAIEHARSALAVLRGEWFGGLAESMKGPALDRRVVILNLFGTVLGERVVMNVRGHRVRQS
jgi:hypothetical protein